MQEIDISSMETRETTDDSKNFSTLVFKVLELVDDSYLPKG